MYKNRHYIHASIVQMSLYFKLTYISAEIVYASSVSCLFTFHSGNLTLASQSVECAQLSNQRRYDAKFLYSRL